MLIPETNKELEGPYLTYGKFLVWIILWISMATIQGFQCYNICPSNTVNIFATAPYCFNNIISSWLSDNTISSIRCTDKDPPIYRDTFGEVRRVIYAWNYNRKENLTPSWISCIDESTMKWIKKITRHGSVFVRSKPWLFGNDSHTITCGMSGIFFGVNPIKGKYAPS